MVCPLSRGGEEAQGALGLFCYGRRVLLLGVTVTGCDEPNPLHAAPAPVSKFPTRPLSTLQQTCTNQPTHRQLALLLTNREENLEEGASTPNWSRRTA